MRERDRELHPERAGEPREGGPPRTRGPSEETRKRLGRAALNARLRRDQDAGRVLGRVAVRGQAGTDGWEEL